MGMGVAQLGIVLENVESACCHFPTGGRAIMLEHLLQRLPEEFQIVFTKAGLFGEKSGNKTVRNINAVRNGVLAAHGAVVALLFFGFGFGGNGHAGDRVFLRNDRVDGTSKGQLHRAAHLTAIDPGGHHRAKGADIIEVGAHPLPGLVDRIAAAFALFVAFEFFFCADGDIGFFMRLVEDGLFLDVDVKRRRFGLGECDEVAHLALERNIAHQSVPGFSVKAWQIAGVRVAIGVAVANIKNENEVITVGKAHGFSPWVAGLDSDFLKKS